MVFMRVPDVLTPVKITRPMPATSNAYSTASCPCSSRTSLLRGSSCSDSLHMGRSLGDRAPPRLCRGRNHLTHLVICISFVRPTCLRGGCVAFLPGVTPFCHQLHTALAPWRRSARHQGALEGDYLPVDSDNC